MTVIRPKPQLPIAPPVDRSVQKGAIKQARAQVKDGFQTQPQRPPLVPPGVPPMINCFPNAGDLFNGSAPSGAGKIGGGSDDVTLPQLPLDGGVLGERFYALRLRNMSPKELFVEEAKQREILEDATTGPIQDADAAAKAEKRLNAIEAERERRANLPDFEPRFPRRMPDFGPLGLPKFDANKVHG